MISAPRDGDLTENAPVATIEYPETALKALEAVQDRVLWLATSIIHHANRVRQTPSGVKVGGHQASSASVVSIMTALWFEYLRAQDRVSVKPHASPVLHAIEYLLGHARPAVPDDAAGDGRPAELPEPARRTRSRLTSRPARWGSARPPRSGARSPTATWPATSTCPRGGRQVALLGDAELDEGACWEAIVDPVTPRLGEVLWIVDLNRQSLDRIVPEIAAGRLISMFEAAGWHTVTVKYGRWLEELFARDGGEALRRRIDEMPNEEYQRLLRADAAELRERMPGEDQAPRSRG